MCVDNQSFLSSCTYDMGVPERSRKKNKKKKIIDTFFSSLTIRIIIVLSPESQQWVVRIVQQDWIVSMRLLARLQWFHVQSDSYVIRTPTVLTKMILTFVMLYWVKKVLSQSLSRSKITLITSKMDGICNSLVLVDITAKTVHRSIPVAKGIGAQNAPLLRIAVIHCLFVRQTRQSFKWISSIFLSHSYYVSGNLPTTIESVSPSALHESHVISSYYHMRCLVLVISTS